MSDKHIDQLHFTGDMSFDKCLLQLQNAIRSDTVRVLKRQHETEPPAQVDLLCGLETMKMLADATLQMAARERSWAERDRVHCQTEKIREN